jgi:hypothetical protein
VKTTFGALAAQTCTSVLPIRPEVFGNLEAQGDIDPYEVTQRHPLELQPAHVDPLQRAISWPQRLRS